MRLGFLYIDIAYVSSEFYDTVHSIRTYHIESMHAFTYRAKTVNITSWYENRSAVAAFNQILCQFLCGFGSKFDNCILCTSENIVSCSGICSWCPVQVTLSNWSFMVRPASG
ncbi:hypothetical protein M378DRAFT_850406 [Amanita muscaria Koide BX008]|uniref:Uncharacterized protein n=1 Tax=Amanita muscaria (strain Koide BX008) TaxID=946122 RepID=A0A0C2WYW1_AMAMK|nr:hypothetical protein M378DRAFT_850406 [Amanita muscaria Koide BX008]